MRYFNDFKQNLEMYTSKDINTHIQYCTHLFLSSPSFYFQSYTHTRTQAAGWVVAVHTQVRLTLMCVLKWDDDRAQRSQEKYGVASLQALCVCSQACACVCVWSSVAPSAFFSPSKHNKHEWRTSVDVRHMTQALYVGIHYSTIFCCH